MKILRTCAALVLGAVLAVSAWAIVPSSDFGNVSPGKWHGIEVVSVDNTIADAAVPTLFGSHGVTGVSTLLPGRAFEYEASGFYSTTGAPTIRLILLLDDVTTLLDTGLVTCATGAANLGWSLHGIFSMDSTGFVYAVQGDYSFQDAVVGNATLPVSINGIAFPKASHTLGLQVTWGAQSPSNTVTQTTGYLWPAKH